LGAVSWTQTKKNWYDYSRR